MQSGNRRDASAASGGACVLLPGRLVAIGGGRRSGGAEQKPGSSAFRSVWQHCLRVLLVSDGKGGARSVPPVRNAALSSTGGSQNGWSRKGPPKAVCSHCLQCTGTPTAPAVLTAPSLTVAVCRDGAPPPLCAPCAVPHRPQCEQLPYTQPKSPSFSLKPSPLVPSHRSC